MNATVKSVKQGENVRKSDWRSQCQFCETYHEGDDVGENGEKPDLKIINYPT